VYSPEKGDGLTGTGIDSDMTLGGAVDGAPIDATSLPENDQPLRRGLMSGYTAPSSAPASEPKGWLERHQTLVGSGVAGAGRAAATYLASGAETSAAERAREQRAANYRSGTRGLMLDQPADPTNARAPVPTAAGPAPRAPQTVGGYKYDKTKGTVDFVSEGD
jgi:hypothetical protein